MASYPLGLLGGPQAPQAPQAPNIGFTNFDDYAKAFHATRDGSEFGGGDYGAAQSERNRMRAGTAPLTGAGLLGALRNAGSVVTGFGLQNPVQMAMRTALAAIRGQPLANAAFGINDIPGQTPFDSDLVAKVTSGQYFGGHRYTIGDAADEQARRNAARSNPGGGAEHQHQGVSAGAGPGGRGPLGGGAYGGGGGVGGYGV